MSILAVQKWSVSWNHEQDGSAVSLGGHTVRSHQDSFRPGTAGTLVGLLPPCRCLLTDQDLKWVVLSERDKRGGLRSQRRRPDTMAAVICSTKIQNSGLGSAENLTDFHFLFQTEPNKNEKTVLHPKNTNIFLYVRRFRFVFILHSEFLLMVPHWKISLKNNVFIQFPNGFDLLYHIKEPLLFVWHQAGGKDGASLIFLWQLFSFVSSWSGILVVLRRRLLFHIRPVELESVWSDWRRQGGGARGEPLQLLISVPLNCFKHWRSSLVDRFPCFF